MFYIYMENNLNGDKNTVPVKIFTHFNAGGKKLKIGKKITIESFL